MLLGCIADDVTGATDLAAMLVAGGMRTVQIFGAPSGPPPDADAVVVALKSRTAPVRDAVRDSLGALAALHAAGCRQVLFKICSTFDSTDAGNIGPVADALIEALGCGFALACPAFPANGRTVYQGCLFVGVVPLNESGMEHHPLTPMRDANLVRVLGRQTEGIVGLVPFAVVERGAAAIRDATTRLREGGRRYAIVDALTDIHLRAIGHAAAGHALVVGGSGVALGLPDNFRAAGLLGDGANAAALPNVPGPAAILSGSCSRATLGQVAAARERMAVLQLDPLATPDAASLVATARDWLSSRIGERPVLVSASAPPDKVAALQVLLGREMAGALVETALAEISAVMVEAGVRRLIVAGGETAGAVVARLGIRQLRIGPTIAPGVPWTYAEGDGPPLTLALKSGNFGGVAFFADALDMLDPS